MNKYDLKYLDVKPRRVNWKVVAGCRELSFYESYDLIFDKHDLKIRQLDG